MLSGTVRRALQKIANACLISYTIKKPHINISEIWADEVFNPEMATTDAKRALLFSHNLVATDVLTARLLNTENENISGLIHALKLYPDEALVQKNQIKYV
jgi:uncharacterized protein (DUF362 family)